MEGSMASPIAYRDKHALIIGINKYPANPLNYCINDAIDLETALKRINFKITSSMDCNRIEFYGIIDTFADRIQCDDLVIFYFAGHGKQYKKENYLLPSDYDYNHLEHEYDYIAKHAINVKYIMKKIDSRQCRIMIYLFDCCRNYIRTRATNVDQGLLPMSATSQGLIVYACAPGKAVIDETRNDRNGSFMENLLKYITIPNKDIKEMIEDVSHDVHSQTKGFQSPQQTSSLRGKVFLVVADHQEITNRVKTAVKYEPNHTNRPFTSINSRRSCQHPSHSRIFNDDIDAQPLSYPRTKSNNKNDKLLFPPIKSPTPLVTHKPQVSKRFDSLESIKNSEDEKNVADLHGQRSPLAGNRDAIPITGKLGRLFPSRSRPLSDNFTIQINSSPPTHHSKPRKVQEHFQNNDGSSPSEYEEDFDTDTDTSQDHDKLFQKSRRNSESHSSLIQAVRDDFQDNSNIILKETTTSSSQHAPIEVCHEIGALVSSSNDSDSLIVRIRSLLGKKYRIKTLINTTMKDLVNIIWIEINFDTERYKRDSHVLLLFNHRLHIFVESDFSALVKDFLLLSPPPHSSTSDSIDIYVYGLPLERAASMYNFGNDCISLFGNPNSWFPVYFIDYKQSERSQSILLSSLYALRLYFRPENQELRAERLSMEAQFFLQLRKYFFLPAILAFKHAIVGSMFWFEKSLLMDALIQLLLRLCNPEKVYPTEICDFIPMLFCWLLEKCDLNEEKGDYFLDVTLINTHRRGRSYFQNPVTTSENNRKSLFLEEFNVTHDHSALQHHVDIRSLTLYLTKPINCSLDFVCRCDDYVIYDPIIQDPPVLDSLDYWTEADIKELYKTIARTPKYRSFSIITRGAVTADVKNQLVLLHEGRTVALLFSQKNVIRSNDRKQRDVDHFFHIFDPLKCTKETSYFVVASNTFLDEREELPDPRLPIYFNEYLSVTNVNVDSSLDNGASSPAYQVTVFLSDRSRSMSDYRIVSTDKTENLTHISMCTIMLGRLSDNLFSNNEVHALGLIGFATKCKTICQITRNRDQFDKALSSDSDEYDREWTCMYDAVREAIRQIKTFTDSPMRARKDCRKLIICLSDGLNNSGDATIENLTDLVKQNNIAIDFISFINDNQLKKSEVSKAEQFRKLCSDSAGYVYKALYLRSDIELATIFDHEAAFWLSKRSRTSHGAIDKPERHISPVFQETAVRQPPSNMDFRDSSRLRRVLNEFQGMLNHQLEDVIIFAIPSNIAFWKVIMKGPPETPYQGQFWMLYVEFDSHYPNSPPDVRFITPIYHVNISGDGKICHQILGRGWCQQTKMRAIFENIFDLLKKPNFDDAVGLEMAHLYKENQTEYQKQAKAHSNKYAKNDIKILKREHRLEEND